MTLNVLKGRKTEIKPNHIHRPTSSNNGATGKAMMIQFSKSTTILSVVMYSKKKKNKHIYKQRNLDVVVASKRYVLLNRLSTTWNKKS